MSQHHEVQDCFPLVTTLSAWGTRIDVKNLWFTLLMFLLMIVMPPVTCDKQRRPSSYPFVKSSSKTTELPDGTFH